MSSPSAVLVHPSVERVRQALERAGLSADIVDLPGAARTAKAAAEFVRRRTGFAIGGVAPVGHSIEKVFVERSLARHAELWAAAGHPHTVFRLSYEELVKITRGVAAQLGA